MKGLQRTQMLLGEEAMENLKNRKIAIFGIGGVGSYVAEGLVRCGVEDFVLVDDDVIAESNLNRQIHATAASIGRSKTEVMGERICSINPKARVTEKKIFVLHDNIIELITKDLDYIVDALDTVTAKLAIAKTAAKHQIPMIAAMGTGNKLNPMAFEVADIYETSICPLCRVMRRELKKIEIPKLKVVYSREEPIKPFMVKEQEEGGLHQKRAAPGSISFVPSVAGFIIAGEVIKDLIRHPKTLD